MLTVASDEFRKDEEVMADMIKVKRMVTEGKGKNSKLADAAMVIWVMLCADDAKENYVDNRPRWRAMRTVDARITRQRTCACSAKGMGVLVHG